MFWRDMGPKRYLIRVASSGTQTSLGPETAELLAVYERFMPRKTAVEDRLKRLKAAVVQHQRLNRALRVGRAPKVLVDTLNNVGTHALYAYESACVIRVEEDATATQDIDLLLDTRRNYRRCVSFVTTMEKIDDSLLSIFQKVDKTFELRQDQPYMAVNADARPGASKFH
jgi:hypothetical protein